MGRRGDWMETFTGRRFWPLDPSADDVCIEDIAHALSMQCRFNGHCKVFYSVAQHCCHVCDLIAEREPERAFAALMHDAAEAYTGDIIRPIKHSIAGFDTVDFMIEQVIAEKYGLRVGMAAIIKWADIVMLKNEHAQLMHGRNEWPSCDQVDGPVVNITSWQPVLAEFEFLNRFNKWKPSGQHEG